MGIPGLAIQASVAEGAKYGALAIDRSNGAYFGWATDQRTQEAAEERALAECKKAGGDGTAGLVWAGAGCAAYHAVGEKDGTAYGWGVATSRAVAEATAHRELMARSQGKPAGVTVWGCNSEDAGAFKVLRDARNSSGAIILTWGSNTGGQLGNGSREPRSTPEVVKGLSGNVSQIAAGARNSLAVVDGQVFSWGEDAQMVPTPFAGLGGEVSAIAGAGGSNIALRNGGILAWGANNYGQLGDGSLEKRVRPVSVSGLEAGVSAISAGAGRSTLHSLAIRNGAVFAWGARYQGSMGDGTESGERAVPQTSPVAVTGLSSGVTAISAGGSFSLAVKQGAVYGWGGNHFGQVGVPPNEYPAKELVPVAVPGLGSGATAVAAGCCHSLAIKDGRVYAWGWGAYGALGNGKEEQRHTPVAVPSLTNVVAIAAGDQTSFAITADGALWAWGENNEGQLGLGRSSAEVATPSRVPAPSGYRFAAVAVSPVGTHVIARAISGQAEATTHPLAATSGPLPAEEQKIDQILQSNMGEAEIIQALIGMVPMLTPKGQEEAAQHIGNLTQDKDYNKVLPLVRNTDLSEELHGALFTDLMTRADSVKLPAMLEIAKLPKHPNRDEAVSTLEISLDGNHGTNWTRWETAIKNYLRNR